MKLPIYIALDVDNKNTALFIAKQTSPYVEGFKIGPRLCLRSDKNFLLKIKSYGKLFLDFKFFDIPSTMLASVETLFGLGADLVTIHALAGQESLKKLAQLEQQLCMIRDFKILTISILTSFTQQDLPFHLKGFSLLSQIDSLTTLAQKCGLSSFVCSGQEVSFIRKKFPQAWILVPGIRLLNGSTHDQKRTSTPEIALKSGASALVMGRPIIESPNPGDLCSQLQEQLLPFIK